MKLLILGATGNLGRHLVAEGLRANHELTVLVRSPAVLAQRSSRLNVVVGSALDRTALVSVLRGQEVVLSALGAGTLRRTTILSDFARALVPAMEQVGTSRAIVTSVAFLFWEAGILGRVLATTLFRNVCAEAERMENAITASPLDWTIVRPPRFSSRAGTGGKYRTAIGHLPKRGTHISVEDLAAFMISLADQRKAVRQIVGIAH